MRRPYWSSHQIKIAKSSPLVKSGVWQRRKLMAVYGLVSIKPPIELGSFISCYIARVPFKMTCLGLIRVCAGEYFLPTLVALSASYLTTR